MAVLSVLGGFLAPIITSTGSNNFTALFSYYIVLNLGIFLMAWFRAWRILNYLAFKFTFGVAVVWLLTRYEPVFLLSSEMFFTAFFVLFFIISIVYAVKQPVKLKGLVDGSLVFGLPIVYFYMQSVLLKPYEYGLAYLAAIMVVVYFGTAFVLRKMFQDRMEALIQSYYAIGVVFITLVGPLALSAQWTSAYWALQGAGLVWIGVRQARTLARFSGLALIVVAGFSFTSLFEGKPVSLDYVIPVLNADFLSSVIKALTALYAGLYLRRQTNDKLFHAEAEKGIAAFVVLYGLCWWYLGLGREIMLHAPLGSQNLLALVLVIGSYLVLKPLARVTQDSFLKQFNLITAAVAAPIILERYWISLAWSCLSVDLVCQLKVMYGDAAKKDSDLVFRHVILLLLMVLFNGILFFHWQSHPALISLGNLSVCVFAVSAFFVAWVLYSETSKMRGDLISHVMILFVFGVFWFVGINYIDQAVSYVFAGKDQVIMIFMLSTLVLSQALHARLYWKAATFPIQVAILPLTAVVFVWDWTNAHPAGDLGWVTHILLIGLMAWSCWLWQHHAKKPLEEDLITAPFTKVVHWFGVLFMISAVTLEAQWLAKGLVPAHPVWYDLVFCLIPAGFLVLLMKLKDKPVWPVMENVIVYHLAVPAALVAYLLGTTWYFNASPGDSGGLAYIPILNPIDLCMIGVFLSLFAWRFFLERQKLLSDKTHLHALGLVIWVFMFFWLNATLLRSVHHWAGVAYTFDDLYASRIAQSAVSIYWALIAMVTMVYSSKKLLRHVWLGGAVLLGLIVCKLVFVDLANRGTFERIVSFIGVGIVFLLIGFFSPLPKKLKE
ncbi:MAG: hypothetical protein ACD_62C00595G0001 [uncultured bacterium]|nr:MAG: hypothetical protein ACD_62C00595G0001 [uncultured bacterium]